MDMKSFGNCFDIDFENDSTREINRKLRDKKNRRIKEAHARLEEERRARRKQQRPRRTGVARLSNTDTITRAKQVRARLLAKLKEGFDSDMCPRAREVFAADIKLQISRVDQTINAIRRRERAMEEERNVSRRDDTPEARRRRFREMQRRSISIRRDFLYHASKGGFDPNMPQIGKNPRNQLPPAITLSLGEDSDATTELGEGLAMEPNLDLIL